MYVYIVQVHAVYSILHITKYKVSIQVHAVYPALDTVYLQVHAVGRYSIPGDCSIFKHSWPLPYELYLQVCLDPSYYKALQTGRRIYLLL